VIPARCSSSTTNRHPVQPSTANVTSPPASEPRQPRPQLRPARRIDPAPPHLPGHGVQVIEGDLSTVDVQPSYDGHYRDLLTLPK
jgi:hypothetical protein